MSVTSSQKKQKPTSLEVDTTGRLLMSASDFQAAAGRARVQGLDDSRACKSVRRTTQMFCCQQLYKICGIWFYAFDMAFQAINKKPCINMSYKQIFLCKNSICTALAVHGTIKSTVFFVPIYYHNYLFFW